MELLDYLNRYGLSSLEENFHIKVNFNEEKNLYLLKYDCLNSPMGEVVVQQACGAIFQKKEDKWSCVCAPFYKFFNAGEAFAAELDWETASIQEKIDGSLVKMYFANGEWNCATNGMPDAHDAPIGFDENLSFYDLICEAFNGEEELKEFYKGLDTDITYLFELVSPKNRLVVKYGETALYALGKRNLIDFKELAIDATDRTYMEEFGIKFPKVYQFAKEMDITQEGFVVCDGNFNRIKIKPSDSELRFAKCNLGRIKDELFKIN